MTSQAYIADLRAALKLKDPQEKAACVAYFEELFAEAGPEETRNIIARLGSARQVAAQVRADIAVRRLDEKPVSPGRGLRTLWIVLLSVLAAPIGLPVAIALAGTAVSLLVTLLSALLALFSVTVSLALVGTASFFTGFFVLAANAAAGLTLIGAGMTVGSLGVLGTYGIWKGSAGIFKAISRSVNKKRNRGITL